MHRDQSASASEPVLLVSVPRSHAGHDSRRATRSEWVQAQRSETGLEDPSRQGPHVPLSGHQVNKHMTWRSGARARAQNLLNRRERPIFFKPIHFLV